MLRIVPSITELDITAPDAGTTPGARTTYLAQLPVDETAASSCATPRAA